MNFARLIRPVSGDLEAMYDAESHRHYVACTRARLLVTGASTPSEFPDGFEG